MARPVPPPRKDGLLRCKFCKRLGKNLTQTAQDRVAYHRECNAAYQRERRRKLNAASMVEH